MSKGTPVTTIRLKQATLDEINAAIASRNLMTTDTPFTVTDWIRTAIREKLEHTYRSRRTPRRTESQGSDDE